MRREYYTKEKGIEGKKGKEKPPQGEGPLLSRKKKRTHELTEKRWEA